jgi:membrane protease YdiL (CAAX protease family)
MEGEMAAKAIETRILFPSLAALLCTEVATRVVLSEAAYSPLLILGVARVVEILLLVLIVSRWGKGMSSIGLSMDRAVAGLKRGLVWSAIFGLCAFLGFAVLYAAHIENPIRLVKTRLPPDVQGMVFLFVVGGLVSPVAEEVFFRGIVYGFLRRWGVLVALIGSTVIFVLAHAIISRIPLTQVVGGLVFATAYEVEGNLMVPITIHALGNIAIFSLSLVL